jgi:hypothetical protein
MSISNCKFHLSMTEDTSAFLMNIRKQNFEIGFAILSVNLTQRNS